jgi:hypothetical protein
MSSVGLTDSQVEVTANHLGRRQPRRHMGVSVPARTWLGLTVSDASDRWYEMVHVPLRPAIKVPFTGHFGGNTGVLPYFAFANWRAVTVHCLRLLPYLRTIVEIE